MVAIIFSPIVGSFKGYSGTKKLRRLDIKKYILLFTNNIQKRTTTKIALILQK